MIKIRTLRISLAIATILSFSGCGSSDSSSSYSNNSNQSDSSSSYSNNSNQAVLGPLSGATINAYRLTDLNYSIETTITNNSTTDLYNAGNFNLNLSNIPDNEWIVVKVTGGTDIDADDDGILNNNPTNNNGTLHLLAEASEFRNGGLKATFLSEILWRTLSEDDLNNVSIIEQKLNNISQVLLKTNNNFADLDGDSQITYKDLNKFFPLEHKNLLKKDYSEYLSEGSPLGILSNRFDKETANNISALLWETKTNGPMIGLHLDSNNSIIVTKIQGPVSDRNNTAYKINITTGQLTDYDLNESNDNSICEAGYDCGGNVNGGASRDVNKSHYVLNNGNIEIYLGGFDGPKFYDVSGETPTVININGEYDDNLSHNGGHDYTRMILSSDKKYLYINGEMGLIIINIEDPYNPNVIYKNYNLGSDVCRMYFDNNNSKIIYIISRGKYKIIDVSNPLIPNMLYDIVLKKDNWNWTETNDQSYFYSNSWGSFMYIKKRYDKKPSIDILHSITNGRSRLIIGNILIESGGNFQSNPQSGFIRAYDLTNMMIDKSSDPTPTPLPFNGF